MPDAAYAAASAVVAAARLAGSLERVFMDGSPGAA